MSAKRKRIVVSMDTRLKVLRQIDNGESVAKICVEFNVGKGTVNDWRRDKRSIEEFCSKMESDKNLGSRCTRKKPICEVVDKALWIWFLQERRRCTPIGSPILKEKALAIHQKINIGGDFVASDGWLNRWKKRQGIHFAHNSRLSFGEMVKTQELSPEQVYNMDETGLNIRMLPETTFLGSHEQSASGFKKNKERITVAFCSNAAGTHKIPLFVIGKSAKPRAFKNLNPSSLPVYYKSQKSAWMNSDLFKEWFNLEFVSKVKKHLKSVNLSIKAILVLDNAPTHPHDCAVDDIKLVYLPPNVTSLVQPMDQGVIESLKRRYRRKLVSEILQRSESEDKGLLQVIKKINIKDVIYILATAFQEMPSSAFVKSWRKLWPDVENLIVISNIAGTEGEENKSTLQDLQKLSGNESLQAVDVEIWMINCDEHLENEFLNGDEIIDLANKEQEEDDESSDVEEEKTVSHEKAKNVMEIALKYIEQHHESTALDVLGFSASVDVTSTDEFDDMHEGNDLKLAE
ncbi:jerky protein homolog-like [Anastrepha obliqua]|uniref:jerky protein homolog-like n=1 Tax=Anastrepha obliqua TaxID=95512 RepID=UPI002409E24B|nr:jerky protein homolog-like [Anastrepha obliqua]